jgi:hypothetical protein
VLVTAVVNAMVVGLEIIQLGGAESTVRVVTARGGVPPAKELTLKVGNSE